MPKQKFKVIPGGKDTPPKRSFPQIRPVYLIPAVLALLLVARITIPMIGSGSGTRVETVVLTEGWIEKTVEFPVVLWRDEEVFFADQGGYVIQVSPEGRRISSGGQGLQMANILPEGVNPPREQGENWWERITGWFEEEDDLPPEGAEYYQWDISVPRAGWISFFVDGYEGRGWEDLLFLLQRDEPIQEIQIMPGTYINPGEPAYKLITDYRWLIAAQLPDETGEKLRDNDTLQLTLSFAGDKEVTCRRASFREEGDQYIFAWEIDREVEGYTNNRRATATMVYQRVYGYKVPESAVHEIDGRSGVFLVKEGLASFTEVTVTDSFQGEVLITGVNPPAMIITNPDSVEEGQRVR